MSFYEEIKELMEKYKDLKTVVEEYRERYGDYEKRLLEEALESIEEAEKAADRCDIARVIYRFAMAGDDIGTYVQRLQLDKGARLDLEDLMKFSIALAHHADRVAKKIAERCGCRLKLPS